MHKLEWLMLSLKHPEAGVKGINPENCEKPLQNPMSFHPCPKLSHIFPIEIAMRSTSLILRHSGASSTYFRTNWPHISDKLATYFPYISAYFPHVSHIFFTNWWLIDTLAPLPSEPLTPLGPVGNSPNPGRQR